MKLGSKMSAESRAKVSAAQMGRKLSPEHKAKIGAASKGRKHTDEAKAKNAASQRRRLADPGARGKNAGKLHYNWRGDDICYATAHDRAEPALAGQPCAHADDTCKGRLECAFKHDTPPEYVKLDPKARPYSPRPEDYIRLCRSHHKRYDDKRNGAGAA